MDLSAYIRDVNDFPNPGVIYKDITPLLRDSMAFKTAINRFVEHFCDQKIDLVLGIEARGFLLASAVAYAMNTGLIIARKPGKLPHDVIETNYKTEYSTDKLSIHKDAVQKGQRVAVIEDVLATGGTANAAIDLVSTLGGEVVGFGFLLELAFLNGRDTLNQIPVHSLLAY